MGEARGDRRSVGQAGSERGGFDDLAGFARFRRQLHRIARVVFQVESVEAALAGGKQRHRVPRLRGSAREAEVGQIEGEWRTGIAGFYRVFIRDAVCRLQRGETFVPAHGVELDHVEAGDARDTVLSRAGEALALPRSAGRVLRRYRADVQRIAAGDKSFAVSPVIRAA